MISLINIYMDAIDIGVVGVDSSGVVVVFNKKAEVLFGIKAEKALSSSVQDILPAISTPFWECVKTGYETTATCHAINNKELFGTITPVMELDKQICSLGIFDINIQAEERVRKKHTEELSRVNRQLDAVFECSYDGLFITSGEGRILKCNRSSERLIGHKQEEIIGKNVLDLVADGWIDRSVTHEVLKKKTSLTILQNLRDSKQIIVTGTPVFNDLGDIEFVVTNERDITSLNRMKAELKEYRKLTKTLANEIDRDYMTGFSSDGIIASDRKTKQVFQTAKIAAGFDSTILLEGETGVGKGRLARFVHHSSPRNTGPFIQVNCGAIPESLIESELFGYCAGAFTGANASGKDGLFQAANKGTLVLDEVSEIPQNVQVKFLKAIEEMEVTPVGGTRPQKVDVRIIASTNKDLQKLVTQGLFRKDLFFRLNVVPIRIPPLRERPDDILPFVTLFLDRFNARFNSQKTLAPNAKVQLLAYHYPGNVRELQNIIERVVVLCQEDVITLDDLPIYVIQPGVDGNVCFDPEDHGPTLKEALQHYEELLILRAIEKHGSKAAAAKSLGVNPSTLFRKRLKFQIKPDCAILHE